MQELRSKRPFKIWDSWRNVRKGLVVSNFEELVHRGKEKLGVPQTESVCLVLESDGTQVEDGEYFKTLANNTILLLLRHGERWCPTGVDIIRAAISAIPKIVCETIHALELHDETPSWKIMDNKGRVTVVLHWDQRSSGSSSSSGQHQQQQQQQQQQQHQQHQQQQQQQHHHQQQQQQQQQQHQQHGVQSSQQHQAKITQDGVGSGGKYSPTKISSDGGFFLSGVGVQRPSLVIQTSLDKLNYSVVKAGGGVGEVVCPPRYSSPQITVINHDDMVQKSFTSPSNSSYGPIVASGSTIPGIVSSTGLPATSGHQPQQQPPPPPPPHMPGRLVKQATNSFESTTIHIHTPECSNHIHHPVARNGSPVNGPDGQNAAECDFHCCALHEEGRRIAVHKSVATSPIQDAQHQHHSSQHSQQQTQTQTPSPQPPSSLSDGTRRSGMVKGHVRFRDTTDEESSPRMMTSGSPGGAAAAQPFNLLHHHHHHHHNNNNNNNNHHHHHHHHHQDHDSSESETENTIMEDEIVTSEKFLLLIDQLTVDQKHHLSIKDIGIILERLSSKILDVERLDRESESEECYNWTIKAVIRGDVLRELGVIYNGNYYAISEHPGYKEESEENNEDNEEEEEEEEDRL